MVFDPSIPVGPKIVEPQGILREIGDLEEPRLHFDETRGINLAFKDGILHTLAVVETDFRDPSQSPRASLARRRDIVGDEKLHAAMSV